jgi:hypothetical protein
MDERMRELERRARLGDQADIDALIKARLRVGDNEDQALCYLHGHYRYEWWYGARTAQAMATNTQKTQMDWKICLRCKLMETRYYRPRWVAVSSATTLTISTDGCSASNFTFPYLSDVPVEPVRTSRGSRYAHPTKKRAWSKRARLSKRELKRRKRKHR